MRFGAERKQRRGEGAAAGRGMGGVIGYTRKVVREGEGGGGKMRVMDIKSVKVGRSAFVPASQPAQSHPRRVNYQPPHQRPPHPHLPHLHQPHQRQHAPLAQRVAVQRQLPQHRPGRALVGELVLGVEVGVVVVRPGRREGEEGRGVVRLLLALRPRRVLPGRHSGSGSVSLLPVE
jgi:hypothetical protein